MARTLIFFFLKDFYLFIWDRERKRESERAYKVGRVRREEGEGEGQADHTEQEVQCGV